MLKMITVYLKGSHTLNTAYTKKKLDKKSCGLYTWSTTTTQVDDDNLYIYINARSRLRSNYLGITVVCWLRQRTAKKKLTDQTNFREANDGRSLRREEVICSPDITISTYFLHLISFFFFLFCFYINWKCDFPLALSYGIVGSEKKGKQFRWCDFCCCCCRMRCDTFETLLDEINHWKVWN